MKLDSNCPFCGWFISPSIMSSSSSVLQHMSEFPSFKVYVYHILFIHLSVDTWGCFHHGAFVNNAAITIDVQISFQDSVYNFFYVYPEIEWLDHMVISSFNFLRNYHTILISLFLSA